MWNLWFLLLAAVALPVISTDEPHACPAEADILPCRCNMRADQLQIWCSHSDLTRVLVGLQAVGTHVTRPVDELILENNHLPSLPGNMFSALRVVRLMLRDNGLERVAASWLAGLEDTLLEVFVVEPRLRSLPADSLEQLRGLEAVTLQGGAIKRLPRFSGLPRLRYVHVQSPALVELSPLGFRALSDLEQLHVTFSPHLTRLEGGLLQDLPRLRMLNVSHCGLAWVHPRALAILPSLKELSLAGNRLTNAGMVGRATRELPALAVLRLDDNQFDLLGEASFVDLPSLSEVTLAGNKITQLQRGAFDRLPALRRLDLSRNRVGRVHPEAFRQQSGSLEELWLTANAIEHVADVRATLDALPRLRYLELSYNYIEEVPFGALRGHSTLERLHLDHNRVQHIQREAFTAMPALRELRLRNNSLTSFADGPLWNLPALKGLDLAYNYFRRLDPRLLTNLPSLRRLDMSGNALEMVDPDAFLNTHALEHVNLSRNAITNLHPATFRDMPGLFELDVGWNRLRELVLALPRGLEYLYAPRNQLTALPLAPSLALPALRLLDLTGNGIQRIVPGSMSALVQLRWLHLGENALQRLEEGSLSGLGRLEVLDLHNNRLLSLDDRCLRDMQQLKQLNLHGNRLERLGIQHLQDNVHLTHLDLSHNQLNSIEHNALANNRELQELDVSHNALTELPEALQGLSTLQLLDLTNNRLKALNPSALSSMKSLSELRLARNKLQQLQENVFHGLPKLELLDLDSNELASMETNAVRSLPELKAVRLGHNRLATVPSAAFSDLPQLQSAELQENQLTNIASNAFNVVPQLLLLNLSYNQLTGLNHAGLKGLKSLEVLDVSHNQLARVGSSSLEGMEWLVELKMDNNHICAVQGSPFNGMPRLRVLSLKNNRMTSLAEPAFQRLRSNIAVLDIDGNPLSCSCGMMWLQTWLKEASSEEGPRCADGSLLKEARLSRQDCRTIDTPAAGCENSSSGPSQMLSTWMEVKDSTVAPSPEESEYFYDEYVEYQYEEGNSTATKNHSSVMLTTEIPLIVEPSSSDPVSASNTGVSSHYIPGDTPTFYAGSRYEKNKTTGINNAVKQKVPAPPQASSGFTFFGIPLPSLSLGTLWGSGRNADAKSDNNRMRFIGARGKVQMLPPTVQSGGFVPMLPGSGGFIPIAGPHIKQNNINQSHSAHLDAEHQIKVNYTTWSGPDNSNMSNHGWKIRPDGPDTHLSNVPFSTSDLQVTPSPDQVNELQLTNSTLMNISHTEMNQSWQDKQKPVLQNDSQSKDIEENVLDHALALSTPISLVTYDLDIEAATKPAEENSVFLSHFQQHKAERNTSHEASNGAGWGFINWLETPSPVNESTSTEENQQSTETSKSTTLLGNLWGMISGQRSQDSPSSLSALLVPGGQQPHFRSPGGRPTITKVLSSTSPPAPSPIPTEEYLRRTEPSTTTSHSLLSPGTSTNSSMDWYFQNYNKTNLEPYVGPGKTMLSGKQSHTELSVFPLLMIVILRHLF